MSSETETTLQPVTFVRDVEPGTVFAAGTENKMWRTEDGRQIVTSWAPSGEVQGQTYEAETLAYFSQDDEGSPSFLLVMGLTTGEPWDYVDGDTPAHDEVLAKLGYEAVPE